MKKDPLCQWVAIEIGLWNRTLQITHLCWPHQIEFKFENVTLRFRSLRLGSEPKISPHIPTLTRTRTVLPSSRKKRFHLFIAQVPLSFSLFARSEI